jgi:hypothetical protein
MATKLTVSLRYGSHLPVLIQAVKKTKGDILELGSGVFSTPYLHSVALLEKRNVTTYENFKSWFNFLKSYETRHHKLIFTKDWNIDLNKRWDMALVDVTPDDMRIELVKQLANNTKYIIIHDSNGRYKNNYHYDKIYPLFKYQFDYSDYQPATTVLSNFVKLKNFI